MTEGTWFASIFVIAGVFGIRGSVRVTRRYIGVRDELQWRERWILLLLAGTCWVITTAALFYGFLSVRTLLGFERFVGLAPISVLLAAVILFLPTVIDYVVERVARVPWK